MSEINLKIESLQLYLNEILKNFNSDLYFSNQYTWAFLIIILLSTLILFTITLIYFASSHENKNLEENLEASTSVKEPVVALEIEKIAKKEAPQVAWTDRLKKGLSSSRQGIWGKLAGLVGNNGIDEDTMDDIEELLYSADIGGDIVSELIDKMNISFKKDEANPENFTHFLKDFIRSKMQAVQETVDRDLYHFDKNAEHKTKVIMIVGVNGAGKTTTIGKLATKLTNEGAKVVVGACDTFRAAAVDQLEVWCERAGAQMVRAKEGANPSGVGYDALQVAMNEKADYCILDTAGRLHTKTNLMEELTKSKNVLTKLDREAPHQTLLVIDAITGQNALKQADEFNKALALTGLIFTKCDGSSKAGSAIGIVDKLQVPIAYIGVGEDVQDLSEFSLEEYLNALLGT